MLKALIFDLDDVLISSMRAHAKAYQKVLQETGINITVEEYLRYTGATGKDILRRISKEKGKELDIREIHKRKKEIFPDFATEIIRIEGTIELVKALKGKLRMALVTSSSRASLPVTMSRVPDIADCFEVIVTGEDVQRGKPDPEPFLKAAEFLNVKPEECLVFEDSDIGIEAAEKAGMKVIKVSM